MSEIGNRIKTMRSQRGMTLQDLARESGNLTYQTIQGLEKGKSKGTKHILSIAKALGVSPEWLEHGNSEAPVPATTPHHYRLQAETARLSLRGMPVQLDHSERIPVLGMAEGGPDGWSHLNGDIIDTIPRPANLVGAPNAYAVYVSGTSMQPRYNPGELVHIHPGKPISIGAYVLVQRKPAAPGEPPRAVVKELVRRSGSKITLRQFNPPMTFDLKADEIVSMHRVVGSSEA